MYGRPQRTIRTDKKYLQHTMADETSTPPCENGIMMMEHDPLEATVLEMSK
jgi:hypothetical protein